MRARAIVAALAIAACKAKTPAASSPTSAPSATAASPPIGDLTARVVPTASVPASSRVDAPRTTPSAGTEPRAGDDLGAEREAPASVEQQAPRALPGCSRLEIEAVTSAVAGVLEGCEKAAHGPGQGDAPASLLALGRVYTELRPALCGDRRGACDGFAALTAEREEFDDEKYDGRQLRRLLERFPRSPEAVEARCLLDRLELFSKGLRAQEGRPRTGLGSHRLDAPAWASPPCRAYRASGPRGPCPSELPGDGDLIELARGCERTALTANPVETPGMLVAAARLYRLLDKRCAREGGPSCDGMRGFMLERSDLFEWVEINGWLYRATLLDLVLQRWPGTEAADDAAYERTFLVRQGECEAFLECEVEHAYAQFSEFLTTRPRSRHEPDAVARLNRLLEKTRKEWVRRAYGAADLPALRAYEQAAAAFAPGPRREALGEIGSWWHILGNEEEAARVRRLVVDAAQTP